MTTTSDITDDQFHEVLENEDQLGMVLRAHIHIEHWLEIFLIKAIPFYPDYKKTFQGYDKKINVACAHGLHPDLKPPLAAIGKLRNNFAHKLDYKIEKSDINIIYKSLSKEHQIQLGKACELLTKKFDNKIPEFPKLKDIEKIRLILIFIRKKLMQATSQLNK